MLGCGPRGWRPEALNIDAQPQTNVPNFYQQDFVKDGIPFFPGRPLFERVIMEDVFEHLMNADAVRVLHDLRERLAVGGHLEIRCPNLDTIVAEYAAGRIDAWELARLLYGNQGGSIYDCHLSGYTPKSLTERLEAAGFRVVKVEPRVKDYEGSPRANNMRVVAERRP